MLKSKYGNLKHYRIWWQPEYSLFCSPSGENIFAVGWECDRIKVRADISRNAVHETMFIPNTTVLDILLFNVHLIIPFINFL